jgi:hypothetical protein
MGSVIQRHPTVALPSKNRSSITAAGAGVNATVLSQN